MLIYYNVDVGYKLQIRWMGGCYKLFLTNKVLQVVVQPKLCT